MAQIPADVSPGDSGHDDHHDALHGLYNHLDTLGGGDATAFVIDEDNMGTDSASRPPSQQSTKAYVDAAVAGAKVVIDPRDFGVLADNSTDDTTAWQAVITEIASIGHQVMVELPPNHTRISSRLVFPGHTSMVGRGAKYGFRLDAAGAGVAFGNYDPDGDNGDTVQSAQGNFVGHFIVQGDTTQTGPMCWFGHGGIMLGQHIWCRNGGDAATGFVISSTQDSTFNALQTFNTNIGIRLTHGANGNSFFGGFLKTSHTAAILIDNEETTASGAVNVTGPGRNTFYSVDIDGIEDGAVAGVVLESGRTNSWTNCRFSQTDTTADIPFIKTRVGGGGAQGSTDPQEETAFYGCRFRAGTTEAEYAYILDMDASSGDPLTIDQHVIRSVESYPLHRVPVGTKVHGVPRFVDETLTASEWHSDGVGGMDLPSWASDGTLTYAVPGGGAGVTRNTHAHSSTGALAITRVTADQDTRVTVTANATSFTDNMSDRDVWHLTLVNGTAADYTVDLSGITSWSDTSTSLTDVLDMHQTTVATLLLRKIEGTVYGTLDVVTEGSPQAGPGAVLGYYTAGGVSTPTVAASSLTTAPQNGDGLLFIVVAPGPSGQATVNYTAPASSTQLADYAGSAFSPRIRLYYRTYAGESNWTFGSDSGITRVAVVAFDNLTTFVAGTGGAVLDATSVAHSVAGIGVYIGTAAWDSGNDSTWTNHPASHSLTFDNRASVASQPNMQLQVAVLTLSGSGTYDPGAATFGPSAQEFSSIAVAATA